MPNINNVRVSHKHDIEAHWEKAINFTPLDGELIIYDEDEKHSYKRLKIGNGKDVISNLPFFTDQLNNTIAEAIAQKSQVQIVIWEEND